MMGNSDDNMVPPLYSEALVHRPEACSAMLEMLTSGGGLAVHPSTLGFESGVHPHVHDERRVYEVAVNLARSSSILSYYDFKRFDKTIE